MFRYLYLLSKMSSIKSREIQTYYENFANTNSRQAQSSSANMILTLPKDYHFALYSWPVGMVTTHLVVLTFHLGLQTERTSLLLPEVGNLYQVLLCRCWTSLVITLNLSNPKTSVISVCLFFSALINVLIMKIAAVSTRIAEACEILEKT